MDTYIPVHHPRGVLSSF